MTIMLGLDGLSAVAAGAAEADAEIFGRAAAAAPSDTVLMKFLRVKFWFIAASPVRYGFAHAGGFLSR
jgi:hypothetical protein